MKRFRRRSALWTVGFCGVLALGSFWVLEVVRREGPDDTAMAARTDPDYFVDKFNFVKMSKTGEAQYNISGERLTHNPADNTHRITLPVVQSLSKDRPPTTTRSEWAITDQDNSKIHLYDKVRVERPKSPVNALFELKSDYLLVLPDDDVMTSDKAVDIRLGESRLQGTGMYANNATRELRLSSNVHAMLPPKAPVATALP